MNDSTSYRILNLSNGDNIIGQVTENQENGITIYRPFQMKVITIMDEAGPSSMFRKEALIMRNWLEFSDDQKVNIPPDKVMIMTQPTGMVSSLYDQEKEKEDNPMEIKDLLENIRKDLFRDSIDEETINKLMGDLEEEIDFTYTDEEEDDEDGIMKNTTMDIGPDDIKDIIRNIIENGKNRHFKSNEDEFNYNDDNTVDDDDHSDTDNEPGWDNEMYGW